MAKSLKTTPSIPNLPAEPLTLSMQIDEELISSMQSSDDSVDRILRLIQAIAASIITTAPLIGALRQPSAQPARAKRKVRKKAGAS